MLPPGGGAPFELHITPTCRGALGAAASLAFPGRIRSLAQKIAAWQRMRCSSPCSIEQLLANPPLARRLGASLKADFELRRTREVAADRILEAIARYNKGVAR